MESIWAFVAVAIPTILSLAVGAMQMNREHPKDFVIARACFWLAGLIPAFAIYCWLCHQPLTLVIHTCATFLLALLTGALIGALLKWVNERQAHSETRPSGQSQTPPTESLYSHLIREANKHVNQIASEPRPPKSQSQKDSEIWDGIKSAWEEAITLREEWQQNDQNPPLQKTEEFINRTLAFAKTHLTLEEIRKLDSPYEQRANIFDPMRSKFDMVNHWWGRLLDYERHLQEIMQTFGRQAPVIQHQSLHDAVAHLGVIGAGGVLPLEIEWVPITKNKANQTQAAKDVVFDGNCLIGVHNPNRTQGVGEATFTLLSISPPFENKRTLGQKLDDEFVKRIPFPIPGIQNNILQGNQRRSINLFTATRPPLIEATLEDIVIRFHSWTTEKRVPEQFSPTQNEHILTVEVSGSGAGTTEVQFRATFSTDQEESVLVLTKLTGLSEAEQSDFDKGNAMFLAIADKIVSGVKPIRALQQANAHELKTNDMLLQMRNDLIRFNHGDPFAPFIGIIPKFKWLGLLKSARYEGIDLGDEQAVFEILAGAIPDATPPSEVPHMAASRPLPISAAYRGTETYSCDC